MLDRIKVALTRRIERLPVAPAAWVNRSVARPLRLPSVPVVTVGGATFGGSGKTRLALAVAEHLGAVLVGHAYRAHPGRARFVSPNDPLEEVGDEALVCARRVETVVAETRQAAVDLAATRGRPIVIDGPLQTKPVRATVSLLAVDAEQPWGGGDLRAPRRVLLEAADAVVPIAAAAEGIESLQNTPFGLFTALARPDRLLRSLPRPPARIVRVPDHGPSDRSVPTLLEEGIEAWVATPKCAIHLERLRPRRPIVVLEDRVALPAEVLRLLLTCVP